MDYPLNIKCLVVIAVSIATLAGCGTIENIRDNDAIKQIGSFKLKTAPMNDYWYNGSSYEYNEYEIQILSWPVKARVQWNGKYIGTTPFIYKFTGVLDTGERIVLRAMPVSEDMAAREAELKIDKELPREIRFDFRK